MAKEKLTSSGGEVSKAKRQHLELLKQILAHADLSSLPDAIQQEANEVVAELGGCAFCGRVATRLCDFTLGGEIDPAHTKWPVFAKPSVSFTCDAPLCERCSVVRGFSTVWGFPDRMDWCPFHANLQEDARPMTAHAAERLRILAWKRSLFTESAT